MGGVRGIAFGYEKQLTIIDVMQEAVFAPLFISAGRLHNAYYR